MCYWLRLKDSHLLLAWKGLRWLLLNTTKSRGKARGGGDRAVEALRTKMVLRGGQGGHGIETELIA